MPDHHVTAFQLWAYYPPDLAPEPPAEAGAPASVSATVIASAIRQREELDSAALRLRLAQLEQGLAPQGAEFPFGTRGWTLVQGVRGLPSCTATLEQGVSGTIMVHGTAAALGDIALELPQAVPPKSQLRCAAMICGPASSRHAHMISPARHAMRL